MVGHGAASLVLSSRRQSPPPPEGCGKGLQTLSDSKAAPYGNHWTKPLEVGQGPITLCSFGSDTCLVIWGFFPSSSSVLWWHTCVSSAMGRLRQESKASLGYIVRSCLSKQMAKSFQPSSCFMKTTLPACLPAWSDSLFSHVLLWSHVAEISTSLVLYTVTLAHSIQSS